LVGLCYTVHGMSLHWMFFLVVKLYQMDVAHAILLCRKAYFLSLTAYYLSAKFESNIAKKGRSCYNRAVGFDQEEEMDRCALRCLIRAMAV
ncbi:hypothetical protein, partial [uncultured Selenomonas sp.]|uniref:hypothetical protein n=1 Tax=uncultured Selenomonas sp. TaxID=159275 RepID=UPI0028EFA471